MLLREESTEVRDSTRCFRHVNSVYIAWAMGMCAMLGILGVLYIDELCVVWWILPDHPDCSESSCKVLYRSTGFVLNGYTSAYTDDENCWAGESPNAFMTEIECGNMSLIGIAWIVFGAISILSGAAAVAVLFHPFQLLCRPFSRCANPPLISILAFMTAQVSAVIMGYSVAGVGGHANICKDYGAASFPVVFAFLCGLMYIGASGTVFQVMMMQFSNYP